MVNAETPFFIVLFFYLLSTLTAIVYVRWGASFWRQWARVSFLGATVIVTYLFLQEVIISQGESGYRLGSMISMMFFGLLFLIAEFRFRTDISLLFLAPLCFVTGVLGKWRTVAELTEGSHPMTAHGAFMFLAFILFSLSFLCSIVYLLQDQLLKHKRIGMLLRKLPSLEFSRRVSLLTLMAGGAAWFVGLSWGFVSARQATILTPVMKDPAAILSVILLMFFAAILCFRTGFLEKTHRVAYVSIITYAFVVMVMWSVHTP